MGADTTFYTISDSRFFSGTVALLNSLRLTGNTGELVVLDRGLTRDQRARLGTCATIADLPEERLGSVVTLKAFPFLLKATGTIAIIDSDMIVTQSLDSILADASRGQICLFPDHASDRSRWFAEWQDVFELGAPPAHRTYLNTGFVALSTEHWPSLLKRWWDACVLIPSDRIFATEDSPFRDGDQDALNAILMSEVPEAAIAELPEWGQVHPDALLRVRIADAQLLRCVLDDRPVIILHHSLRPKGFHRDGWRRVRVADAYIRLLPRVLFADDVELQLERGDVPIWVTDRPSGTLALRSIDAFNRVAVAVSRGWHAIRRRTPRLR